MSDRTQQIHRLPRRIPQPLAGAELSIKPDGFAPWRILSLLFTFTTSAVVATRQIRLALSNGSETTWKGRTTITQAATTALEYQAYPLAVQGATVDGLVSVALPPDGLWLPRGWALTTTTALIDAGDQYSAITVDVQEILDGPDWMAEPSMNLNTVLLDQ